MTGSPRDVAVGPIAATSIAFDRSLQITVTAADFYRVSLVILGIRSRCFR
jgi:hypothetical protein